MRVLCGRYNALTLCDADGCWCGAAHCGFSARLNKKIPQLWAEKVGVL